MVPKISILISAYNEQDYIQDCVNSCVQQTYENIEIVVFNDGSYDKTSLILKENYGNIANIHIIDSKENKGKIFGFNTAYNRSTGEYIHLLGGDDVLTPNCLSNLVKSINISKKNFSVFHEIDITNDKLIPTGDKLLYKRFASITEKEVVHNKLSVAAAAWLIPGEIAKYIFPIPEQVPYEDAWISFAMKHYSEDIKALSGDFYYYRQHSNNTFRGMYNNNMDVIRFRATRDVKYIKYIIDYNPFNYPDEYLSGLKNELHKQYNISNCRMGVSLFFAGLGFFRALNLFLSRFRVMAKLKMLVGKLRK